MKKNNFCIVFVLCVLLLGGISAVVPQTLSLQGKLTNSSNDALNGTYNMTFKIYDVMTGGSSLWVSVNNSITTDGDGIYNFVLNDVNLSFDQEYYVGIKVESDVEMTPRINLTSTPYTFRTQNISAEGILNDSNMDLTGKTGFFGWLGSLLNRITTLFVQDIDFTGTINGSGWINTTANISADYYYGDGSKLTNLPSGGNLTWNESHAETLFAPNTTAGIQHLINDTGIYETYNTTYALYNQTYNSTYDDYAYNVSLNYTERVYNNWNTAWLSTFNTTYDKYALNVSRNWTAMTFTGYNSTWDNNWVNEFAYNHTSSVFTLWNSTWDDGVSIWDATFNTSFDARDALNQFNTTYDKYALNVSRNWTDMAFDAWGENWYNHTLSTFNTYNSTWDNNWVNEFAYNHTSSVFTTWNSTWDESGWVLAEINTTANIQGLLNDTGIYETYNTTYDDYSLNVSRNWTAMTFTGFNSTWDNSWVNEFAYNHTSSVFTTWNSTWDNRWINTLANLQGVMNASGIYETFNTTYDDYALNVSRNWTAMTFAGYNTTWDNNWVNEFAYNHTSSVFTTWNSTWDNRWINTLANLQGVMNASGIYETYNTTYALYNQTYNATYDKYALNVSRNWTAMTFAGYNSTWDNNWVNQWAYNHTSSVFTTWNSTWDNRWINTLANLQGVMNASGIYSTYNTTYVAINTTANIQGLLNDTGIYETYNTTYDDYALNVSKNYTKITFDTYNSTWDNNWVNVFAYNHTSETFNTWNSTWDESGWVTDNFLSIANSGWNRSGTNVFLGYTGDKVGIGTDNPGSKLTVWEGDFNVSNAARGQMFYVQNSSGNVGIGTDSPDFKLETVGAIASTGVGAALVFQERDGAGDWAWYSDAGKGYLWTGAVNAFSIVASTGNVGIGTTSPQSALDIRQTSIGLPATTGSTNNAILRFGYASDEWGGGALDMGLTTASPYSSWIQSRNPLDYSVNRNLLLNPNGGDVGIGTTDPSQRLHVNGSANITGNLHIGGNFSLAGEVVGQETSRMRYTKNNAQTFTEDTVEIIEYNDLDYDNLGEYDVDPWKFTATEAGYYMVIGDMLTASSDWTAGDLSIIQLWKNGAAYQAGSRHTTETSYTGYVRLHVSTVMYLAATDYVDVRAYIDRGGNTNSYPGNDYNQFVVQRLRSSITIGAGGVAAGAIVAFNLETCPTGWVVADGTGGTPDLRGIFVRGAGTSEAYQMANGTYYTAPFGTSMLDSFQGFDRYLFHETIQQGANVADNKDNTPAASRGAGTDYDYNIQAGVATAANAGKTNDGITAGDFGTPRVGGETAPASYALTYCMKTTEDTNISNTIWGASGDNVFVQNISKNVGIGTTSPGTKLEVDASSDAGGIYVKGGEDSWSSSLLGHSTSGKSYGEVILAGTTSADKSFDVRSQGGTQYLLVRGDGNVGIGTDSPGRKLEVEDTGGDPFISIRGAEDNSGGLLFGDDASDASGQIRYNHNTNYMGFATAGTSDQMIIDSAGNVDIAGALTVGSYTTKRLVIPRALWYGDMTQVNWAIDGVRSGNANSNKDYAMDIPLGNGHTIVYVRTRQIFDGTGTGTVYLQKAEYDDTSWTTVDSWALTSGTTTRSPINYVIENKMAVRIRVDYNQAGGTYTYFYPTEIGYIDNSI